LSPAPPRWRKLRRAAKWVGILAAALALFVLLLPTIITLLPTGRIVGHFADPAVGGTVEIEGIRTGWLGHVRVGKVALYPDKNRGTEPFLLI